MIEPGQGLGLAEEPAPPVGFVEQFQSGDLERDPSIQGRIERQKDDAMSAAAQLALDQELAERPGDVVGLGLAWPSGLESCQAFEGTLQPRFRLGREARVGPSGSCRSVRRAFPVVCRQPRGQLPLQLVGRVFGLHRSLPVLAATGRRRGTRASGRRRPTGRGSRRFRRITRGFTTGAARGNPPG